MTTENVKENEKKLVIVDRGGIEELEPVLDVIKGRGAAEVWRCGADRGQGFRT